MDSPIARAAGALSLEYQWSSLKIRTVGESGRSGERTSSKSADREVLLACLCTLQSTAGSHVKRALRWDGWSELVDALLKTRSLSPPIRRVRGSPDCRPILPVPSSLHTRLAVETRTRPTQTAPM